MKKINFITNMDVSATSGGWGGINFNIYNQLKQYLDVNYVGPINPKMIFHQKIISKILRGLGFKAKFSFLSKKRLNIVKNEVRNLSKVSDYDFFFGQMPWVNYEPKKPYGVYLDADFKTYLNIFSTPNKFRAIDIERISRKEEHWLKGAKDIFVGSEWAWKEMLRYYDLKESQKVTVHTGGNIDLPEKDVYENGLNLIFISLNFEKKGGFICVEAFKIVKKTYPDVTLTIIGQEPPKEVLNTEGVIYAGFLRKSNELESAKFKTILSKAFLLIHPTKMDTMGAVLIEAGYFGCPSIAPNSFGVPELVLNNQTGFIIDVPFNSNDFSKKIEILIRDKSKYLGFRERSWEYTRGVLTWESIGRKIKNRIEI